MNKRNEMMKKQLGVSAGTAYSQLRKMVLFSLLQKYGEDICFQCDKKIESVDTLSIEHKVPWLHDENAKELFFDMSNISFSHLTCNSAAARPRPVSHPSHTAFQKGCRCEECVKCASDYRREYRLRPEVKEREAKRVGERNDYHKNRRKQIKDNVEV